jgi:multidrug efflux pump subunit AcrA (membrane-fusion protein)
VKFVLQSQKNTIAIPKNSLFTNDGKDYVWLIDKNNKTLLKEVKKGFKTEDSIVILEGLKTGDILVYNPQEKEIKEGMKVSYIEK